VKLTLNDLDIKYGTTAHANFSRRKCTDSTRVLLPYKVYVCFFFCIRISMWGNRRERERDSMIWSHIILTIGFTYVHVAIWKLTFFFCSWADSREFVGTKNFSWNNFPNIPKYTYKVYRVGAFYLFNQPNRGSLTSKLIYHLAQFTRVNF
jgi:hypothetical protein